VIQRAYQLVQLMDRSKYGWWNETTTTYVWHGPRLVKIAQSTLKRRVLPRETVGVGCISGIA
jgi:hypothetical protein